MVRTVATFLVLLLLTTACGGDSAEHSGASPVTPAHQSDSALYAAGKKLSLEGVGLVEGGDWHAASEKNEQALNLFQQAFEQNPQHEQARLAIGHTHYLLGNYFDSAKWFEIHLTEQNETAVHRLEYGLSYLHTGALHEGHKQLVRALELDASAEMRQLIVSNIVAVAEVNFGMGGEIEARGDEDEGHSYQKYAIGALMVGHSIDTTDAEVIRKLVQYAEAVNDAETADYFRERLPK